MIIYFSVNVIGGSSLITINNCTPADVSSSVAVTSTPVPHQPYEKAYHVVKELLETEESYCKDLHLIDKVSRLLHYFLLFTNNGAQSNSSIFCYHRYFGTRWKKLSPRQRQYQYLPTHHPSTHFIQSICFQR